MKTTPRYALHNLYLDRDQIDTLVATYALSRGYRYGSDSYRNQGQEEDDEVKGKGNSVNYTYRMHDPRLGRWLTLDPKMKNFADKTPYNSYSNNPIIMIDPDGGTDYYNFKGKKVGTDGVDNGIIGIIHSSEVAKSMRKGVYNYIENPKNGQVISGGFFLHEDVMEASKQIFDEALKPEIVGKTKKGKEITRAAGSYKEFSMSLDKSEDGRHYVGKGLNVGKDTEEGFATVKMNAGEVSIHSHPLGILDDTYFENLPSFVSDNRDTSDELMFMFKEHEVNIIIGYAGKLNVNGPKRILHMNVYGSDAFKLRGGMTKDSLDKILKTHNENKK